MSGIKVIVVHELTNKKPTKDEITRAKDIVNISFVSIKREVIAANGVVRFVKKLNGITDFSIAADDNKITKEMERLLTATISIMKGI